MIDAQQSEWTLESLGTDLSGADLYTLDPANLRHADSYKWTMYEEGVIPLWIADMDYAVAPPILAALQDRLQRGLGYHQVLGDPTLIGLLQRHLATKGITDLPEQGIAFMPSVMPGLYMAVAALTAPGDPVLTMTPIYHPFHLCITEQDRRVASAPLREEADRWEIDWEALEQAAQGARLFLLCHPHNPTGRIWDTAELARLRDFVLAHDLLVVSDELHADLRYTNAFFESFAADPRIRSRTLTLTGPCKAYNTAGLGIGAIVSHDVALLKHVRRAAGGMMGHPSALSVTMWQAALQEGGPWLQQTLKYLQGNRDVLHDFVRANLPWARTVRPEATYLSWLDLRAHPQASKMQPFLLEEARVAVQDGPVFAPEAQKSLYQGFVRVNFATSRALLTEALSRIERALL